MNVSLLPTFVRVAIARKIKKVAASASNLGGRLEAIELLTQEHRRILSRNGIFKDKHKGKRCFVIVNGPSLKQQDITKLKDEITFAVSGFWKHPVMQVWQPTYYSLLDANFFRDDPATIQFFSEMNRHITQSTFFLPLFRGFDANAKGNYLNAGHVYYVASCGDPFPSVDLTRIVQGFQGVSAFALAQAIYMGCSPIYLLGFDHDYLANRGVDKHFYDGGTIPGAKGTDVPLADRIPYDQEMEANLKLWRNYRSLKECAARAGVNIFNATAGGYLDVFPRVDFNSLVFADSGAVS